MQDVFKAMARVVNTDLTVLISGDSGTEKNWWRGRSMILVAVDHPFVAVNLAVAA